MDTNLPRWSHASMAKFFSDLVATLPSDGRPRYHVEGVDEDEALDFQHDSILFRMVGPYAYGGSNTEWFKFEIQVLCTDIVQTTKDRAWTVFQWAGVIQDAMLGPMPIYKFGDGPDDDRDVLVGCLQPDDTIGDAIRVVPYGQVDKEVRVKQVAVIGKFLLCL